MFGWFTNRSKDRRKAEELYGAVVAAARTPAFFKELGVPDTPEGRFEMLSLMLFLAVDRFQAEGAAGEPHAQRLIEAFVTDMDDCHREMGIGDLKVPKKVRQAAAAFYERGAAYREAVAQTEPGALVKAIGGYVFAGQYDAGQRDAGECDRPARLLAGYARTARAALRQIPVLPHVAGGLQFPAFSAATEPAR
jgi:cytochrome b pre-mRNA-processing protein 3